MLQRKLIVCVPIFFLAFANLLLGHCLLLQSLRGLSWGENLFLLACVVLQSVAIVSTLTLLAGSLPTPKSWAVGWAAVVALSTIPLWDVYSYRWLGLHLHHTVPFLYWSAVTTFRAIQHKRMSVFGGLAAMVVFGLGFVFLNLRLFGTRGSRSVPVSRFVYFLVCSIVGLGLLEMCLPWVLTRKHQEARWRGLPLIPLLIPRIPALQYSLRTYTEAIPGEEIRRQAVENVVPATGKRPPDIYLFIIESLRADALVPEVAPHLSRFRAESLPIPHGLSGSNCTHISWYSILHGRLPLFWSSISHQAHHKTHSLPIAILKKLGYQIKVIATPNLSYYAIAETLFGQDRSIASEILDQTVQIQEGKRTIAELDRGTMDHLKASFDTLTGPTLTLVFLDSTHHDYEWLPTYRPPFEPFLPHLPITKIHLDESEWGPLRNRYKNAVSYVDSLMGEFMEKRKKSGRPSIVAITGDHGEELMEMGHLTHSSDLNRFQVEVPLLIAIPGRRPASVDLPASHVDIFPTLLDAVGVYDGVTPLLDGRSLLRPAPEATAVVAQCSNYVPFRYLIDAEDHKALVEYDYISKMGLEVFGRGLSIRSHLDATYRDYAADQRLGERLDRGISRVAAGFPH